MTKGTKFIFGFFLCTLFLYTTVPSVIADASLVDGTAKLMQLRDQFTDWMREHDKVYSNEEFGQKWETWQRNQRFIDEWNADESNTHELAMNKFGDLTDLEFGQYFRGLAEILHYERDEEAEGTEDGEQGSEEDDGEAPSTGFRPDLDDADYSGEPGEAGDDEEEEDDDKRRQQRVPASWDWRTYNVVTPVKMQGSCGACYAFTSAAAIESAVKIAGGPTLDLSEQQITDCSGNAGCGGGSMTRAFNYIKTVGGIASESAYPYTGRTGSCRYTSSMKATSIANYVTVRRGDEADLMAKVYVQPVAVGIDSSRSTFRFYRSGVYYDRSCSSTALDHAVTVVGWGTDPQGGDYWIIKNSWGTSWGTSGYAKMARNRNNHCGITNMGSAPCLNGNCQLPRPSSSPTPRPSAAPKPAECTCPN